MAAAVPLIAALLKVIEALAPVIALVLIKLYGQRQAAQGAQLQAAKTDAVTAQAETAIADAEVKAPATRPAVIDQLNQGKF